VIAVATRKFGAPIRRNEDARLLTGQALFVDDVELPGMLQQLTNRLSVG
jgi:carbon-monoxide dehydrogenase large subunit